MKTPKDDADTKRRKGNPSRADIVPLASEIHDPRRLTRPPFIAAGSKEESIWDDLIARLEPTNLIRPMDSFSLGRYCCELLMWIQAKKIVDDSGMVVFFSTKAGDKRTKSNPAITDMIRLSRRLQNVEDDFGMTPAARQRIYQALQGTPWASTEPVATEELDLSLLAPEAA